MYEVQHLTVRISKASSVSANGQSAASNNKTFNQGLGWSILMNSYQWMCSLCMLTKASYVCYALSQGFPTFLLSCTPSAFRQMSMYPFSISKYKHVPLQYFERWTCTPKISYDKIFYHDYHRYIWTISIQQVLKIIFTDICINIWK